MEARRAGCDRDDMDRLRTVADIVVAQDAHVEHLLVKQGERRLRVDLVRGSLRCRPLRLLMPLTALCDYPHRQQTVQSLIDMLEHRRVRYRRDARLDRLVLGLQALDATEAGATLREIAEATGLNQADGDWPGPGESTRSSARRLVALGRRMSALGPIAVLQHRV